MKSKEEVSAEIEAYMKCGSSPCEDCDKYRHDENKSVEMMECREHGGCKDYVEYYKQYIQCKQECLKQILERKK